MARSNQRSSMCITSPPGASRLLVRSFTSGERCIAGVVPWEGSPLNHLVSVSGAPQQAGRFPEAPGNVPDPSGAAALSPVGPLPDVAVVHEPDLPFDHLVAV